MTESDNLPLSHNSKHLEGLDSLLDLSKIVPVFPPEVIELRLNTLEDAIILENPPDS